MRIFLVILSLLLVGRAALADEPVVLAVERDKNEIVVNLGGQDGVGAGAELDLLNEVVVKDPVSGQTLRDRFPIGRLTVTRAGDGVSVASASAELLARVQPGDPVALAGARKTYRDPWEVSAAERGKAAGAAAEAELAATDPRARQRAEARVADATATREVWARTLGKPPEQRIALWQELIAARPGSGFVAAVEAEVASLRRQIAEAEVAARQRVALSNRDDLRASRLASIDDRLVAGRPLYADTPERVVEGRDLVLAFAMRDPAAVQGAWLYVHGAGSVRFERIAMSRSGDAYLRARVPASAVVPPALEYFVELAGPDGEPHPVIGSEAMPMSIAIAPATVDPTPERRARSRVTLTAEYVDFDGGFRNGFDEYYQVEADFMYRFLAPIYAVRLGFGTLSGQGGPKDVIDADLMGRCEEAVGDTRRFRCESLTYSYIYAEFEHRFSDIVAVMLRPTAGQRTTNLQLPSDANATDRCQGSDNQVGCDSGRGLGLRLRTRLGEETKTNIALGVGVTEGIGTLLEAAFSWNAYPAIPVTIAVQVTDQPVVSDFGVRLVGDVGWRSLGWMYPSLRLSYQARDVDHAGFSGGLGVNFDW